MTVLIFNPDYETEEREYGFGDHDGGQSCKQGPDDYEVDWVDPPGS